MQNHNLLKLILLTQIFLSAAYAQTCGSFQILGDVTARTSKGVAYLTVNDLRNYGSPDCISGTIELTLWATRRRYQGQANIVGYPLVRCTLIGISGGYGYNNIRCKERIRNIKRGSYFITITSSEFDGFQYLIQDYRNIKSKFRF